MKGRIRGSDNVETRDGYNYRVGRFGRVGVRSVKPKGSLNLNYDALTPHTEQGKRMRGWKLEWVILVGAVGAILYGLSLIWPYVVAAGS